MKQPSASDGSFRTAVCAPAAAWGPVGPELRGVASGGVGSIGPAASGDRAAYQLPNLLPRFSPAGVERRAGRLLRLMRGRDLFRALGFVRLGDYVVERLGVSSRSAQEWMRVDEALERLPLAAAAFEAGEITSGHVRLLTRVARPENEAYWVGLARRSGVRAFASTVAAGEKAALEAAGGDGGSATAGPGSGAAASLDDDAPETVRLEIPALAWLAASWREGVAFIRRLTGAALPAGECLEYVLAELPDAGGPGSDGPDESDLSPPAPGSPSGEGQPERRDTGDLSPSACVQPLGASPPGRLAARDLSSAPASEAAASHDLDARAMDRELRALMAARQSREWNLAESLRGVAMTRSYRTHGFKSLEEYGKDRLGLSPRRLYHLLALQRTLDRLPLLRRAFLAGRVTFRQALLVGSVATIVPEGAWIERARRVTLRRLEDEVCFWRHVKEVRPAVWEMLEGGPLPEGIVLVPGREPRLQASAGSPAGEFLRALEFEERTVPMPEHRVRIRLRVEPEVKAMWDAAVERCRGVISPEISEWEVLALAHAELWRTWDNSDTRRQRRENPTIERDGWRCSVPGCRSVGTGRLQEHHVIYRAHGGSVDDPGNVTCACTMHHLRVIHDGFIRCSGRAPDGLVWEMGVEPGKEPFLVYSGETRTAGTAV